MYTFDPDLEFLSKISSEDLDPLVQYLIKDKDGEIRWTEELTTNDQYTKYYPDHSLYWREIAGELQCFGANSIMNIFRGGKGVLYNEILKDVCDKLKVNYNKKSSVDVIEMNLLMKIMEDSMTDMSAEDLNNIVKTLEIKTTSLTPQAITVAIQASIRLGGFMSYQIATIVANAIAKALLGSGLAVATNATISRAIGIFAGPIGWLLTGIWTAIDITGPAYRVTIPSVIQIAFLRTKLKLNTNELCYAT